MHFKRDSRMIGNVAVAIVVLSCSSAIVAQTGLPSGTGDPVGAFGSAGPSDLLNGYYSSSLNWVNAIKKATETLFWALAAIDFTWTCITLVLQHNELQPWLAGFIRKILTIGFFAILLENGQEWTTDIVNFFIGLGSSAGGRPVAELSASGIMGGGVELAGRMLHGAASVAANTNTSPIGLLIGGVGNFAPTLILALGSLLIVFAFVMVALHFVMAMVEAYVVIGAGYIFLGFGGSRWTLPYTQKYMGMVVSAGVRIMVLELIIGMGSSLLPQWQATADAIAKTPDIFSGGTAGSAWSGVQSEFGLVASIAIFALLCWTIPKVAGNVASGGLSMSGGDALEAATAAATGAWAAGGFMQNSGSPSSGSGASDVASIAQSTAAKVAEYGAMSAATAGTGGFATAGGAAIAGIGPAGGEPMSTPMPPTNNATSGMRAPEANFSVPPPARDTTAASGSILNQASDAFRKMPQTGGPISGPSPEMSHGE
jgi:type IV secretion system protein TrbL